MIFASGGIISGIVFLISALVISPVFEKIPLLTDKPKKRTVLQFVLSFIIYFIAIFLAPTSSNHENDSMSDVSVANTTISTSITDETTTTKTTTLPVTTSSVSETTQTTTTSTTTSTTITATSTTTSTTSLTTNTTTSTKTTTTTTTKSSKETALNRALEFIDGDGYSYIGLIDILEFVGYTHEDAVYAADNCGADWNQEAVESAKSYLEIFDFSKERLIQQLIGGEEFTEEQAEYAASQFDLKSENETISTSAPTPVEVQPVATLHFIVNLESNCIHIDSGCSAAQKILQENRAEIDISASDLGSYYQTYWACGKCSKAYSNILPKF
ncbi:MAG: Ltp family lipoprotein [Ruminococcus flavefaciens]|nr:Ltp family lipoprotein [Ruminococcus flavefaciens]